MKQPIACLSLVILFLVSCHGEKNTKNTPIDLSPKVLENGMKIVFPTAESTAFFETETVTSTLQTSELTAPAKVAATIVKSDEGLSDNLVLFENPDLAANYTQLIQHLINIKQIQNVTLKQRKIELERIRDLQEHGAASGHDLLEAQTALATEETNLANEKASIIEHETKLKSNGFLPEILRTSQPGTAYVICDIPENQLSRIKEKSRCRLVFTSFPNEKVEGWVENIADVVDQSTRMIKLRIVVNDTQGRLKAGMFAIASFGISEGANLSVNRTALMTVQAKNYVFVKTNPLTFERREVTVGTEVNDRLIVFSGVKINEHVAIKGAIQLKGLSFGY